MNTLPKVVIRKKEEHRLLAGHLWAFSNELVEIRKDLAPGELVELVREGNNGFIGYGFYHPHSLIAARIVSFDEKATPDDSFFEIQFRKAVARRELLQTRRNAVRLIHGESDFLPGLIIDLYNDIVALQITSAGFEARKAHVIDLIKRHIAPRAIVEKNNSHLRKLEGLPEIEQVVEGSNSETEIHDAAGTRYRVDVLKGQKTGFFLDQMENRTALRKYIQKGDSVLDLFSNEGGFGINAALAGAANIVSVDASQYALSKVKENAILNNIEKNIQTAQSDCFDFVKIEKDQQYDAVVLDPPALVRSKKDLNQAKRAYFALNGNAMRITKPEGILLTASCSHHLDRSSFLEIIQSASEKSKRSITILEERGAGIDHPVLLAMPETKYLKVFILRVH